jgi:hypothetical protein
MRRGRAIRLIAGLCASFALKGDNANAIGFSLEGRLRSEAIMKKTGEIAERKLKIPHSHDG